MSPRITHAVLVRKCKVTRLQFSQHLQLCHAMVYALPPKAVPKYNFSGDTQGNETMSHSRLRTAALPTLGNNGVKRA